MRAQSSSLLNYTCHHDYLFSSKKYSFLYSSVVSLKQKIIIIEVKITRIDISAIFYFYCGLSEIQIIDSNDPYYENQLAINFQNYSKLKAKIFRKNKTVNQILDFFFKIIKIKKLIPNLIFLSIFHQK